MNITYYGHNSFLVEFGGKKLLFDPFISGNGMASNIDVNSIEADYILLSHGHQDHILDAESIACLLYTSPSPRDLSTSRMPSSA